MVAQAVPRARPGAMPGSPKKLFPGPRTRALGVRSGPMSAPNGAEPAPPRWPADLINALAAWVADELGEPHPTPRRPACRPFPGRCRA